MEKFSDPKELAAALTKRNKAGQQQPYVPPGNGDASGEYRENDYGGDIGGEVIDNKEVVKIDEPKKEEGFKLSDESNDSQGSSFTKYINDKYGNTEQTKEFGGNIIKSYELGNDDGKRLVDFATEKVGINVTQTSGIANWSGSVNLAARDVGVQGKFSSYVEGEVFYHEFHHCFDEIFTKDIKDKEGNIILQNILTDEDRSHVAQASKGNWLTGALLIRNASTAKVLSNGKTLFETIQDETKRMKKDGTWIKLQQDYKNEIESKVIEKYPDWKEKTTLYNETESKYREEARRKYPITWQDIEMDNKMRTAREEFVKEKMDTELSGVYDYIKEVRKYRSELETETKRSWMSISDMYGISHKTPYGFCGGHTGNYGNKIKGAIALEMFAEYGSASVRNDPYAKREIEIFEKYMPESSKMCEELRQLIINHQKGVKA